MKHYSFDIPKHWESSDFIDILISLESGKRPKGGVGSLSKGIPSLGGEHLNDIGSFDFSKIKFVSEKFADTMILGHISTNDILIVKDGATTGKVSYIDNSFKFSKAVINEHLFLCRVSEHLSSKYIFFFLFSDTGQKLILQNNKSGDRASINKSFASNLKIPLPPLQEQKQIAEKLETELSILKTQKEKLQKEFKVKYKKYADDVLDEAVNGGFLPKYKNNKVDLNYKNLSDYVKSFTYGTSNKSFEKGDVPVLRMGNIQDGKINWKSLKYTSNKNDIKKYILNKGDILFNRTNSPELVGKTAYFDTDRIAIYAGYLIKIDTKSELEPKFLNFCLNSNYAKQYYQKVKTGVANQANINATKLGNFLIPVFSVEDQQVIIKKVEESHQKAYKLKSSFEKLIAELEKAEADLFNKAFSGKLIKPIPNDIPVSKLLEKIKEEKAILEKQRKELQKKRRKMPKKEKQQLDIIEVLKLNKDPMPAVDVWKNSKYHITAFEDKGIDNFYSSLAVLIEEKKVFEDRRNNLEIYLSLNK